MAKSEAQPKTDVAEKAAAIDPGKVPEAQKKDTEAHRDALPIRGDADPNPVRLGDQPNPADAGAESLRKEKSASPDDKIPHYEQGKQSTETVDLEKQQKERDEKVAKEHTKPGETPNVDGKGGTGQNVFTADYTVQRLDESPNEKGPKPSKEAVAKDADPEQDALQENVEAMEKPRHWEQSRKLCEDLFNFAQENGMSYQWALHVIDLAKRQLPKYWVDHRNANK